MTDPLTEAWQAQRAAMGAFIRSQRELADMSLRELSRVTQVSNAYLSQIERGLHDPTLKVLLQIANALNLSIDDLLSQAVHVVGTEDAEPGATANGEGLVEAAIAADRWLTDSEKQALLTVYRSYTVGRRPGTEGLA